MDNIIHGKIRRTTVEEQQKGGLRLRWLMAKQLWKCETSGPKQTVPATHGASAASDINRWAVCIGSMWKEWHLADDAKRWTGCWCVAWCESILRRSRSTLHDVHSQRDHEKKWVRTFGESNHISTSFFKSLVGRHTAKNKKQWMDDLTRLAHHSYDTAKYNVVATVAVQ